MRKIAFVIVVLTFFYTLSYADVDLTGEYWFGSLSVDINTNEPCCKRGAVVVTDNNWEQVWEANDGNHTFSSTFITSTQVDGSINIDFLDAQDTYNVAWNGDVMIHAGSVLGGDGEGIDIFMRKATDVEVNDVLGDHGFFGHYVGLGDDTAVWGNATLDPNGTAIITWTNDHNVIESGTFNWDFDDVNSVINVYGTAQYDPEYVAHLLLGKGGIASTYHIDFEEGRDGNDIGYNIFVKKTNQVITMADIAGTYQDRFLETGPNAVPYTCFGTSVIEAVDDVNGILWMNAYYSNGEHEVSSIDCSVGPGNEFHIDDNSVPNGIISPEKNLGVVSEYLYENPPARTKNDWLGGMFAVRMLDTDCKYLVDGDLNRDCKVDFNDFAILAAKWLANCEDTPLDPACRCDITWVAEPAMNVERDQFAGGVIDGKIYVFGGNGNPDGGDLKSTEVYDPATKQWTMLADNNSAAEELTSAVVDGKLYVFGACFSNFNEMYDPITDTWTTLAEKPTPTRGGPTTVYNNKIYTFGGMYREPDPNLTDVVECYDPNTDTWQFVTNMPKVIGNFCIATIGDKAYLFGGGDWTEPSAMQFNNELITYDFNTNTWDSIGDMPDSDGMFYSHSVAVPVIDGKVYLVARGEIIGSDLTFGKKADIYDIATNTWEEGNPLPLPLNIGHMALAIDGKIYVLGGCNTPIGWGYKNQSKREVISLDTNFCSP